MVHLADLLPIQGSHGEVNSHVIFLHGLGGDPDKTWQASGAGNICWLQWLAEDIEGLAVWSIGYDAAVSRWRGSAMHLTDRATNVLERILLESKLNDGEITLVGHSFGGLVIKQLLRDAESMSHKRKNVARFVKRVHRIAFIATPHSGSGLATWGDRLRILIRPSFATTCLVRNDPNLRGLNHWYREWSDKHNVEHLILIENQPVRIAGMIVKPDSSDPGVSQCRPISIDSDHISICKPKDRSSEVYLYVRALITRQLDAGYYEPVVEDILKSQAEQFTMLSEKVDAISPPSMARDLINDEINKQLSTIRKSRFFREFSTSDATVRLSESIQNDGFASGSDDIKSRALAWCARILSVADDGSKSEQLLNAARQLGSGSEITIAEAFKISAQGKGDLAAALKKLAGINSPPSRSAAFLIVANHQGADSAIQWLMDSGVTNNDLDAVGKFILISKHLDISGWDKALEYSNALQDDDFHEAPVLLHVAAMSHLVQAVPYELRTFVLQQIPFDVRVFPFISKKSSIQARREARTLFERLEPELRGLGLIEAAHQAADYALWLELRDPDGLSSGCEKLRESMRQPEHRLRRLHFALKFNLKIDKQAVEREVEQLSSLSGGGTQDTAWALFSLIETLENAKDVVAYIDKHRGTFKKHGLNMRLINTIEIEALAKAGLSGQAEEKLISIVENGLSKSEEDRLRRIFAEATGSDPIETRKAQFESSNSLSDLHSLVTQLEEQNDYLQLCHYGALLFDRTKNLSDAECLGKALNEAGRFENLSSMLRKYQDIFEQSDDLQMLWSWALYREGLLAQSTAVLEKLLRKRDHRNDRALRMNLAVASGDWESLSLQVEDEWINRDKRNAEDLMRAAQLAQFVGSSRAKDLTNVAVSKEANNASILLAAYTLASNAGWEGDERVTQWLHTAADLSNDSGPVQLMSIKDLMDRKPEWNRREAKTWQQVYDGIIPIFGAARLLNRSLIDMFLLPALANPSEQNIKRRALVPAYSGVRQSLPCDYRVVAMEATALLTLGSLGLLEKISEMFESVVIPHTTLGWLFEEKQRVSFHQPSRIIDAKKLLQLLSNDSLKVFNGNTELDDDLVIEAGEELASMLAEAQVIDGDVEKQKVVIRSNPVLSIGSLMEEEVDLSAYSSHLCSCLAVVNKLKQKGLLTLAEEELARSYLSLVEKEWPHEPTISDGANLYLDDLSVSYLQHTGLLEKLHVAGLDVYVTSGIKEESNTLICYEQLTFKVSDIIESIRKFLATGIQDKTIKVGALSDYDKSEEPSIQGHPTFAIFGIVKDVEAVVVDDRCLNQHLNIENDTGHVPILTTLDLIEALHEKDEITFKQLINFRTELRRASYLFISVTSEELEYQLAGTEVIDGSLVESAELKAIRENILRIRMSHFLQLPKEAPWLINLFNTFSNTLKAQWKPDIDETTSIARSEWLLKQLDVRGWSHCLISTEGEAIQLLNHGAQFMTLLLAPLEMSSETKEKYLEWIDMRLLANIREEDPDFYSWIINRVKELVSHACETTCMNESE